VIEAVTDANSDILDPARAAQAGEFGRNIYAQGIWYGMFHGNLQDYVEKAIERSLAETQETSICPRIRDALDKFRADTKQLPILPQKPANACSAVITR
jgi:hypothetical protein